MNNENKLKIEIKIMIVVVFIAMCFSGWAWHKYDHQQELIKEHYFMLEYLPERAVLSLEKWSEYFELNKWSIFYTIITESNGDQYAKSHANCLGYMQLAESTADACRDRLYELIKWKRYNIYTTDINIASGCLHLANLKRHFIKEDNELLLIEVYNTGWFNYDHYKRRAPKHVKRYTVNKTFFETKFKRFRIDK